MSRVVEIFGEELNGFFVSSEFFLVRIGIVSIIEEIDGSVTESFAITIWIQVEGVVIDIEI